MRVGSVVAMIACVTVVFADEPNGELRDKVASLVSRLDASTLAERSRAQRELIDLGTGVLPFLPPADLVASASAGEALQAIRIHLERQQAAESAQASRVTLDQTLPLSELLSEVSRQTGNQVDLFEIPDTLAGSEISARYANSPFWQVMDDIAERTGLEIDERMPSGRLRLVVGDEPPHDARLAVASDSAVRVSLLSAEKRSGFLPKGGQLLRVRLGVTVEPRLRPLFLRYSGRDLQAMDAADRPLPAISPDAQWELPFGRHGKHLDLQADFLIRDKTPAPQAGLRGRLSVQLAAGSEAVSFGDLSHAEGAARRRGGVNVRLQKVRFQTAGLDRHRLIVDVTVAYETGGPAFESHRLWVYQNEAYLETQSGRRLDPASAPEPRQQADGAVVVRYTFHPSDEDPENYRFVYVAPTLITTLPVEFEFADFPVVPPASERSP